MSLDFIRVREQALSGSFDYLLHALSVNEITEYTHNRITDEFMKKEFFECTIQHNRPDVLQACYQNSKLCKYLMWPNLLKISVLTSKQAFENLAWTFILNWSIEDHRPRRQFYTLFYKAEFVLNPVLYKHLYLKLHEMSAAPRNHSKYALYKHFIEQYNYYHTTQLDTEPTDAQMTEFRNDKEAVQMYNRNRKRRKHKHRIYLFEDKYNQIAILEAIKERDLVLKMIPNILKDQVLNDILEYIIKPYIPISFEW